MSKAGIIKSAFIGLMENNLSLVSYLAKNGCDSAVTQALKVGGKIEDAMYGYALAGNKAKVKGLIDSANDEARPTLLGSAIRGFAATGDSISIQGIEGYKAYKAQRVLGMAEAGKKDEVIAALDKNPALFPYAVEGYATSNHGEHLKKLIKGTRFYPLAIYHAARAGNNDLVDGLLKEQGVSKDYIVSALSSSLSSAENTNAFALLNQAIRGYTAGHHFTEAALLLSRGASISQCIGELKSPEGSVSIELIFALLAHINDERIRTNLVEHIARLGEVDEQFKVKLDDLAFNLKVSECMRSKGINYIEAVVKQQTSSGADAPNDVISLPYLAEMLCGESPSATSSLKL